MCDERLVGATSAGVGEDNGVGTNAEVDDTSATTDEGLLGAQSATNRR